MARAVSHHPDARARRRRPPVPGDPRPRRAEHHRALHPRQHPASRASARTNPPGCQARTAKDSAITVTRSHAEPAGGRCVAYMFAGGDIQVEVPVERGLLLGHDPSRTRAAPNARVGRSPDPVASSKTPFPSPGHAGSAIDPSAGRTTVPRPRVPKRRRQPTATCDLVSSLQAVTPETYVEAQESASPHGVWRFRGAAPGA
jgi:hypothetical protein